MMEFFFPAVFKTEFMTYLHVCRSLDSPLCTTFYLYLSKKKKKNPTANVLLNRGENKNETKREREKKRNLSLFFQAPNNWSNSMELSLSICGRDVAVSEHIARCYLAAPIVRYGDGGGGGSGTAK